MQVITASRSEWIVPFTGLQPGQFRKLVAMYRRTNPTMRQIGPLFGVSHSAAHRIIDALGPLLALAPVRTRRIDQVTMVDGSLVPPATIGWPRRARTTASPK
jgi:Helix-turn-helix of DDE superfamily endonuclease